MQGMPAGVEKTSARADTVDPILDVAADLFEKHGFEGTRISDIVARASVGRETIFRRYRRKEEMLAAIVDAFTESFSLHLLRREGTRERCPNVAQQPDPPGRHDKAEAEGAGADPSELPAALCDFSSRHGALARVALSVRDVPWVRSRVRSGGSLAQIVRYHLGAPDAPEVTVDLALDVLKHVARQFQRTVRSKGHAPCETVAECLRLLAVAGRAR